MTRARQASLGRMAFEMEIGIDAYTQARIKNLFVKNLFGFKTANIGECLGDCWENCRFISDTRHDMTLENLRTKLKRWRPFLKLGRFFGFPLEIDFLDLIVRKEKESEDYLLEGYFVEYVKGKVLKQSEATLVLSDVDGKWLWSQIKLHDLPQSEWSYLSQKEHLGQRAFYKRV
ncbi:MAG: hypothetical protein HY391_01475 [Deltaproteobacteria bacterium]|nr:hypothetical protein [Deltaproteobacteria bacterium]